MNWSTSWPTAPGWYWTYGTWRGDTVAKLLAAEVKGTRTGLPVVVMGGVIMYRSEWQGVWQPMVLPTLPEVSCPASV